jgi:pimeloyl-ACP methyl ester carboxylesterase
LRVLAFDLYGFGLSSAPSGRLDLSTYVGQLQQLLDALNLKLQPVLLLGYSLGGLVAVEFVRRHPERVARVLLVAPGGFLEKSETPCAPLVFTCIRGRCGGCLELCATTLLCCGCSCVARRAVEGNRGEKYVDHFELDVRQPELFRAISRNNLDRFVWDLRRSINSWLRVLRRMPLWAGDSAASWEGLASSAVPVLFLWGSNDCTVPWSECQEEVSRLFGPRQVSCVLIPGAGHGLLVEDVQQVGQCAVAWFTDLQAKEWLACLARFRLPVPGASSDEEEEAPQSSAPKAVVMGKNSL